LAINVDVDEAHTFAQALSCKFGESPLKYLAVPLHYKNLRKEDRQPVIDKVIKKS
jgi:hypothetical protein